MTGKRFVFGLLISGASLLSPAAAESMPSPKEGLLVRKADADHIRQKLQSLHDEAVMVGKKGIRVDVAVSRMATLDIGKRHVEAGPDALNTSSRVMTILTGRPDFLERTRATGSR